MGSKNYNFSIVKENEALKKAFKKLAEKNKDAKEALKYAAII